MKTSSIIPVRWIIAALGSYACALVYTQRAGMSVAIVAMTVGTGSDASSGALNQSFECSLEPNRVSDYSQTPLYNRTNLPIERVLPPEFTDWSETLQGVILGSQFYLYVVVPSFAGRATDFFGGKWIALAGALGPAILSAILPTVTRAGGAGALIAVRTLMGGFHGLVYASLFSLYIRYFPTRERANANAAMSFGGEMGSAVMYLLAGALCRTEIGWPLVFYVNSLLYIPWVVLWLWFCANDPLDNPRLSPAELQFIQQSVPQKVQKKHSASWAKILTSGQVLCSLLTKFCCGFGYFLLLTKMPTFLSSVFGIDIFKNGSMNAGATFARGCLNLVAAPLSNWIITRFRVRSIVVRKAFQTLAMGGPALCLCLIPLFGCNSTGVIVAFVFAVLFYGFFTGGEWTTISEYAPNSAGTVYGVANILAFLSAVLSPYLVGIVLDAGDSSDGSRTKWNGIFFTTAGVYLAGAIMYDLVGTDQQQEWDRAVQQPQDNHETEMDKPKLTSN